MVAARFYLLLVESLLPQFPSRSFSPNLKTPMVIHSTLDISGSEYKCLPKSAQDHLIRSLTYANPAYAQASRLGFSTHGIPKDLKTCWVEGETLRISRGEARKVMNVLASIPLVTELTLEDGTINAPIIIEYTNKDFDLDERQFRCVDACLNTNQGIIHAATSAGKSAMMMALIGARKQRTLIVVNRKVLLEQLKRDAEKWLGKKHIGTIAGGVMRLGDVTFALEKSLLKFKDEIAGRFGMVLFDECHISTASSFQAILQHFPARYRYGFTGTVKRKDQMQFLMHASFGGIIATVTKDELEEAGRTTPVKVEVHETTTSVDPEVFDLEPVARNREMERVIHADEARLGDVCMLVDKLLSEKKSVPCVDERTNEETGGHEEVSVPHRIAIASRFLAPLERLGEILASNYPKIRFRFVTGKEKNQDENCQALERGEIDVLLTTIPCFSTGVNVPSLTDIILISPVFSNELMLHQLRGRLMRKHEGKEIGTLHFLFDANIYEQKKLQQFLAILRR